MNCVRDNFYPIGSSGQQFYVSKYLKSSQFKAYVIIGYIIIIVNLIMKAIQITKLDFPKLMCDLK